MPLQKLVGTMSEVSKENWDSVCTHDSKLEEIRKIFFSFLSPLALFILYL